MSENDGHNVVASAIRRQIMVRDPILGPLDILKMLMVRDGLSVSEAIRKYTNMYGLPPEAKDIQTIRTTGE